MEPDIWKIEGIDRREDCELISATHGATGATAWRAWCSAVGPTTLRWITGCGWVRACRYIGFAIGRSIWWDPLKGFVDGNLGREEAAKQIAANYRRFIDVYNER